FVVVLGQAANREGAVDRGAAAHDPRLLVAARGEWLVAVELLVKDPQATPVKPWVEIGDAGIAVEHACRDLAGRGVGAGLDEEDAVLAGLREPVRKHRSGGAAADDDEIVSLHRAIMVEGGGSALPAALHDVSR